MGEGGVGVDAAIAEEGPDAAVSFQGGEVEVGVEDASIVDGGFGNDLSAVIRYETLPPEGGLSLRAAAVDGTDVATVRHGMPTLHCFPSAVLGIVEWLFAGNPADGSGVEKNFRPLHSRESCRLRVPLIPANEHPNAPVLCLETLVAQVAGGEVEFFFKAGVLRDVHFAVDA